MFSQLPALTTDQAKLEKLRSINNFFTGEYDTVLFEATGEPELIDGELGVYIYPKPITELERVSYVVSQIQTLCCRPKNRMKLTPTGEMVMNESFRGLSKEDAFKLENW